MESHDKSIESTKMTIKRKAMKTYEYCPHCRKTMEHIKDFDEILCLKCGKKSKRIDMKNFADLQRNTKTASFWTKSLIGDKK